MIDSTNPEDIRSIRSLIIDLATLRAATENFDERRKLGEGGFGAVYKVLICSYCMQVCVFCSSIMWEFGNILYQTLEWDESNVHVQEINLPITK